MGGLGRHCLLIRASLLASGSMGQTVRTCPAILVSTTLLTTIVVYKLVLLFNKTSVVCLYYRIFAVSTKSFRVACHVMSKCLDWRGGNRC